MIPTQKLDCRKSEGTYNSTLSAEPVKISSKTRYFGAGTLGLHNSYFTVLALLYDMQLFHS